MGNNISGATTRTPALDSYVAELRADIIYEKKLGSGRFLRTVKGRHRNGPLVIKIFVKLDPSLPLLPYRRRLKLEREALSNIPNVYSNQVFFETENAGYIIRQWLFSSLYDRISTRPFLSTIEKKWIAFQIMNGLQGAVERKTNHGDIKSENILVTSWNWVYITDFGSIKPVFLPEDDPTDYSFYFDTSGRRACYIAPERFYSQGSETSKKKLELEGSDHRDGRVKEAMDVFSAGCVIAEMFLEGQITFTLSQLFKYRSGDQTVTSHLNEIEDEGIRSLVMSMISLNPKDRPTFGSALESARGECFPESFYAFLHGYIASLNTILEPLTSTKSPFARFSVSPQSAPDPGPTLVAQPDPKILPSDSDNRLEQIWKDFAEIEACLAEEAVEATVTEMKVPDYSASGKAFQDVIPVELAIPDRPPNLRSALTGGQKAAAEDGTPLIVLSLVTANIRSSTLPSSKIRALDLLLALSCNLTDESKLDRLVPYVIDLLHDEASSVRVAAIRTLVQVLALVSAITPANASIFPEYILPNIRHLCQDSDVSVRCMYAQCISTVADTAMRYLEMGQALKAHGMFKLTAEYDDARYEVSSLQELRTILQEQVVSLLFDASSVVKRATLINISNLCGFFGGPITNDVLLSHMITYLNDRDWMLRWAFFDSILGVAPSLGPKSVEEFIFPLMIQALSDVEESVVARVLYALTTLCDLSQFSKMRKWELMSAVVGFLYHPNIWIRQGAAAFLASAAKSLPSTDVWCILYPGLKPHLRSDIRSINELSLLMTVKSPLSRQVLDGALQWVTKADKSQRLLGLASLERSRRAQSGNSALISIMKTGSLTTPKLNDDLSEEDAAQVAKLRDLGMTSADESKLLALRDYISKLANSTLSFQQRDRVVGTNSVLTEGKDVELQKLHVTPHTVFLGAKDGRPNRSETTSRNSLTGPRTPILGGTPRMSRLNSLDPSTGGTGVEDFRRKLTMESSMMSLSSARPGRRESFTNRARAVVSPTLTETSSAQPPLSPFEGHPGSASDSASTGIDIMRRRHQKAAVPVVGSVNTNISGVLEAPKVRTAEEEVLTSGRTSPQSVAGTVKGQLRLSSRRSSAYPSNTNVDLQDPGINNLLEAIYQENYRDPTTDFGPKIHTGPIRKRNTGRLSYPIRDVTAKRSEVTLIAHLAGHSSQVTGVAVAPDHAFFVTCSDDETVKVWDAARLERNVTSKPRQTYSQHHSPVTCVCMLEASHCFASAAKDGSLHVVRVSLTQQASSHPRYKQLQVVREHRVDRMGEYVTCMIHYNSETTSNLVYATTLSTVVILELRTMRVLHTMDDARHHGPITCMCIDRKHAWLLTGSFYGVLTLWDLRFGLRLKSWPVSGRVHSCTIHPTRGKGRWVMVAVETQSSSEFPSSFTPGIVLVEVWDVENVVVVETFVTQEPLAYEGKAGIEDATKTATKPFAKTPADAIAALLEDREGIDATKAPEEDSPHPFETDLEEEDRRRARQVGVRAMVVGSDFGSLAATGGRLVRLDGSEGFYSGTIPESGYETVRTTGRGGGFLLTGSEDRKIRLWDLSRIDRSMVVSGLELESDRPTFRTMQGDPSEDGSTVSSIHTESHIRHSSKNDRPMWRTSLIGNHQQQLIKGHQDCITALACLDVPFRCGIVSGDRTGVVKVFRIESE